jgi:hypothetical protein
MNPATKAFAGTVVDLGRRRVLLHHAVVHHRDLVRHRHRLELVVRDVDGRRLEPHVQPLQLAAHRHAQLRVEVGQRLVHEEEPGLAHHRTPQRDALALSAGELPRLAAEEVLDLEHAGDLEHARVDLCARRAADLQPVGHVGAHVHVRVERVALEHHRDVALARREVRHPRIAMPDRAAASRLEPRDDPQQRGLAAAARPHRG